MGNSRNEGINTTGDPPDTNAILKFVKFVGIHTAEPEADTESEGQDKHDSVPNAEGQYDPAAQDTQDPDDNIDPAPHGAVAGRVQDNVNPVPHENTIVMLPATLNEQFENDIDKFDKYKPNKDDGHSHDRPNADADDNTLPLPLYNDTFNGNDKKGDDTGTPKSNAPRDTEKDVFVNNTPDGTADVTCKPYAGALELKLNVDDGTTNVTLH